MSDSLGAGSGRPGIPRTIGDFSVGGIVPRVVTTAPVDADWGNESPPDGTIVFQHDGSTLVLWTRWDGVWQYTPLDLHTL